MQSVVIWKAPRNHEVTKTTWFGAGHLLQLWLVPSHVLFNATCLRILSLAGLEKWKPVLCLTCWTRQAPCCFVSLFLFAMSKTWQKSSFVQHELIRSSKPGFRKASASHASCEAHTPEEASAFYLDFVCINVFSPRPYWLTKKKISMQKSEQTDAELFNRH